MNRMVSIRRTLGTGLLAVGYFLSGTISTSIFAADIEAGKKRSMICSACHGNNGISIIPNYPNLAGQKEAYLVDSLKAYRDGVRRNMLMTPIAQRLSDEEINNLAAYYASLDPRPEN